jgi:hypothetical protein
VRILRLGWPHMTPAQIDQARDRNPRLAPADSSGTYRSRYSARAISVG